MDVSTTLLAGLDVATGEVEGLGQQSSSNFEQRKGLQTSLLL